MDRQNVLAAKSLLSARRLAREFSHAWIGSEHLLLGILALDEHPLRELLRLAGAVERDLRAEVERIAPAVEQPEKANLPLAESLRRILECAAEMTESHQLEEVMVEHLLLALLQTRAGLGYAMLVKQGVDVDDLERLLQEDADSESEAGEGNFRFGA